MTKISYRADIDGLRAISVIAVLLFHFGWMPNGYLGVDVFFVISGFLMARIIGQDLLKGDFTLLSFYERRLRRILPLVTTVALISVLIGLATMLPDDLENLAQSAIATLVFANNILQAITTKNYWDVVNEYKPLLHTWSLGVEEQFYIIFPGIFLITTTLKRPRLAGKLVAVTATLSLFAFLLAADPFQRFYWLWYRYWELAAGAIVGIYWGQIAAVLKTSQIFGLASMIALVVLLCMPWEIKSQVFMQLATVLLTCILIANSDSTNALLRNPVVVWIGLHSFGIYMWHQPVLAFTRYALVESLTPMILGVVTVITVLLSMMSRLFIEEPFRSRTIVSNRVLIVALGSTTLCILAVSTVIYMAGGVIRDVPELDLVRGEGRRAIHAEYNHRIYESDKDFDKDDRVKILVLGNSYARDWANVLLESTSSERIQITYIFSPDHYRLEPEQLNTVHARSADADIIFLSTGTRDQAERLGLDATKVVSVGEKNFGNSNGIYYNSRAAWYGA